MMLASSEPSAAALASVPATSAERDPSRARHDGEGDTAPDAVSGARARGRRAAPSSAHAVPPTSSSSTPTPSSV